MLIGASLDSSVSSTAHKPKAGQYWRAEICMDTWGIAPGTVLLIEEVIAEREELRVKFRQHPADYTIHQQEFIRAFSFVCNDWRYC